MEPYFSKNPPFPWNIWPIHIDLLHNTQLHRIAFLFFLYLSPPSVVSSTILPFGHKRKTFLFLKLLCKVPLIVMALCLLIVIIIKFDAAILPNTIKEERRGMEALQRLWFGILCDDEFHPVCWPLSFSQCSLTTVVQNSSPIWTDIVVQYKHS